MPMSVIGNIRMQMNVWLPYTSEKMRLKAPQRGEILTQLCLSSDDSFCLSVICRFSFVALGTTNFFQSLSFWMAFSYSLAVRRCCQPLCSVHYTSASGLSLQVRSWPLSWQPSASSSLWLFPSSGKCTLSVWACIILCWLSNSPSLRGCKAKDLV